MTDDPDTCAGRYDWERLIRRVRLGAPAKAVALAMATYADADGSRVRPGVARLAAVTELSERSVYSALKKLRALGLVDCLSRGGHRGEGREASVYRLTIPVDLIDRVELLDPSERPYPTPALGAPWEQSQPAPHDSQPAPGSSQPAPHAAQPAPGAPHHYLPTTHQPTDQRDHHLADVTTDRAREDLDEELFALNGGRRRMHR